jgi:hypothetical protein
MKQHGVELKVGDAVAIYASRPGRSGSRIPNKGVVKALNQRVITVTMEWGDEKFSAQSWDAWGSGGSIYRRYMEVWNEEEYQNRVRRFAEEERRVRLLTRADRLNFRAITDNDMLEAIVQSAENFITQSQAAASGE